MFRLRSYVNDYEIQVKTEKNGTSRKIPVYVGPQFVRVADDDMNRRLKRIYAAAAVLQAVLFLGCGLLDNAGNRNMINALAYACSCFPVVYCVIGMNAALRLGERIERREYDMSVRRMKHSAVGIMILYPIAFFAEIASLFMVDKKINILTEFIYLILCVLMFLSAGLVRYLCHKYPYRKEEEKKKKE